LGWDGLDLPQPKRGTPGWGSLTLTCFGDAGVTGAEESMLLELEVWRFRRSGILIV
jgi:hypothetical protein